MSRSRRQFLADLAKGACSVGLLGVGLGSVARQQVQAVPAQALRPPAALGEADFLRCLRALRALRRSLPLRHPQARPAAGSRDHGHPLLRGTQRSLRDV